MEPKNIYPGRVRQSLIHSELCSKIMKAAAAVTTSIK